MAKPKMVKVNLFVGKSKRIWTRISVPSKWMEHLQAVAKKKRVALDAVFSEEVRSMIERYRARLRASTG